MAISRIRNFYTLPVTIMGKVGFRTLELRRGDGIYVSTTKGC